MRYSVLSNKSQTQQEAQPSQSNRAMLLGQQSTAA